MTEPSGIEAAALLPCPFCNSSHVSDRHVRDGRQMFCINCGASVAPTYHGPRGDTLERAKEAWNKRASPAASGDLRERIAQALLDRFNERSACRGRGVFRHGTKVTDLPASYKDDFFADADAILASLPGLMRRQSEKTSGRGVRRFATKRLRIIAASTPTAFRNLSG